MWTKHGMLRGLLLLSAARLVERKISSTLNSLGQGGFT